MQSLCSWNTRTENSEEIVMPLSIVLSAPIIALGILLIPYLRVVRRHKQGKTTSAKRYILSNAATFLCCVAGFAIALPLLHISAADGAAAAEVADSGIKYIAAALSTGLACLGAGIAVGMSAPAAVGATSEDPKNNFSKSIVFVVLGEGIAIYGMLISILILFS
jgi:V/A-type H+-transporting ATPase subunit K